MNGKHKLNKFEMSHILNSIDIKFTKREDEKWILEHSNKYYIISESTKILIQILIDNKFDLNVSYKEFLNNFEAINKKDFEYIVDNNLKLLELDNDSSNKETKEKSFILFETQILNPTTACKIAQIFTPLFQPTFFWITMFLLAIFATYCLIDIHHLHLSNEYLVGLVIFYLVTAFIHELGHISACKKFTGDNGEIGLGIYFIFPVFYSNITPIWKANKQERIITNLAGVYIQMIFLFLLYIFNKYLQIHEINDAIKISILIVLYQLIPFIRTDGYWILTDLFNSPNLLPNSTKQTKKLLNNPFKLEQFNTKKDIIELIYGLFNYFVMIYIIGNIITNYQTKLITVPFKFIETLITDTINSYNFFKNNLEVLFISLIFYLIIYNFIKNISIKKSLK